MIQFPLRAQLVLGVLSPDSSIGLLLRRDGEIFPALTDLKHLNIHSPECCMIICPAMI